MEDPELAPVDMSLAIQRMSSGVDSDSKSDYTQARLNSARKRRHRSAALKDRRALTQRDNPDDESDSHSQGTMRERSDLESLLMRELRGVAEVPHKAKSTPPPLNHDKPNAPNPHLPLHGADEGLAFPAKSSFQLQTPKGYHDDDGEAKAGEGEGEEEQQGGEGKEGRKLDAVDMMDPYEQMAELVFMLEEREHDLATAAQIGCELVAANEASKKRIGELEGLLEGAHHQQSTDRGTIFVLQSRVQELAADKQTLEERVHELEERSAQQLVTRMAQQQQQQPGNQSNNKQSPSSNEQPGAANPQRNSVRGPYQRKRRQSSKPQLFQEELSEVLEDLERYKAELTAAKRTIADLKEEALLVGDERRDLMVTCERLERQQRQKDTRIRELMLDIKKARATIQSFEDMVERDRVFSQAASRRAEAQRAQQDREDEEAMSARPSHRDVVDEDLPPVEVVGDIGIDAPMDEADAVRGVAEGDDQDNNGLFLFLDDADGGAQAKESVPSPMPPRRPSSMVEQEDVPVSAEGMEAMRKVLVLVDDKLAKRDALRWWMLYVLRQQLREAKASHKGRTTARTHRFMGNRASKNADQQAAQSRPKSHRKLKRPPQLNLAKQGGAGERVVPSHRASHRASQRASHRASQRAGQHNRVHESSGSGNQSSAQQQQQQQQQLQAQEIGVGGWWKSLTSIIGDAGGEGANPRPVNPKGGEEFARPKDRKPKVAALQLGARSGSSGADDDSERPHGNNNNNNNNNNNKLLRRQSIHEGEEGGGEGEGGDEDEEEDEDDEVVAARQRAERAGRGEGEKKPLERSVSRGAAAPLIARGMQRDSFRELENDGGEFISRAQAKGNQPVAALHLSGLPREQVDDAPKPAAFKLVGNGEVVDGEGDRQREFFFFVHSSVLKRNPNLIVGAGEGNDAASLWHRAREEQVPYEQWDAFVRGELTRAMLRRKYSGAGVGLPAKEGAGSVEDKVKARLRQRMERGENARPPREAGAGDAGADAGQFLSMFRRPVNGTFEAFSSILDSFSSGNQ